MFVIVWVITLQAMLLAVASTVVCMYSVVCSITLWVIELAAFSTSMWMYVAVCSITEWAMVLTPAATSLWIISGVISMKLCTLLTTLAISIRIAVLVCSIRLKAVMMSSCAWVTRWWMPFPSTTSSATRLQSWAAPSPATASATMATWSVVSTNQAWSSSAFLAAARPPPPLFAFWLLMMLATSSRRFASVTVTFSFSLILSAHCSFVTFSVISVSYSGSGTRHIRLIVNLSRGSPVASLRSSPFTVTVTLGSQCRAIRSLAHRRSSSFVSLLWSVSVLLTTPYRLSFRLT